MDPGTKSFTPGGVCTTDAAIVLIVLPANLALVSPAHGRIAMCSFLVGGVHRRLRDA